jgi:excisionase family DNA binding protein
LKQRRQAGRNGRAGEMAALRVVERIMGRAPTLDECSRLLTAEEAARFLALAEPTVRDMTYRHELPCVKVGARGVRYQLVELIAWIDARKRPAGSG